MSLIQIECLTDETFLPGYRRTTYRRPSPKYDALSVGDSVLLTTPTGAAAQAQVMAKRWVTVDEIAATEHVDGPYLNGVRVLRQLAKVYPDARLDSHFFAFDLEVAEGR